MRNAAVLAAVALMAAGCMGTQAARSGRGQAVAVTSLQISVWTGGTKGKGPVRVWTLRCPAGGTLPSPARACRQLAAMNAPFAPVPEGVACTLLYGGPQVAEIRGRFNGRGVTARFSRTNGCEIDRWNRVRFLFPVKT